MKPLHTTHESVSPRATSVRASFILVMGLALMALTGCQTIPQSEYADFTPMAEDQRVIKSVKLSWDIRPDAAEYCAQSMKSKHKGMMAPPIACATWSAKAQTCTIVTTPNPNHVVIGHEVRHCFEGHFHH